MDYSFIPLSVPQINAMSVNHAALNSTARFNRQHVQFAAQNLTKLTVPGLQQCHTKLEKKRGYDFVSPPRRRP